MKVLFLCTAFNSLSQRMALVLRSRGHTVTVELALSPELMITAAELAKPDIVICPFLTKRVPKEIYTQWLTLIVHPGPPGDAGPSAIDWCLFGDDGESEDSHLQLATIDAKQGMPGAKVQMRSHWGVTVLQAIEALDAGPIWAFDQFALDEATKRMTKSDLYRGPITRSAVRGVLAALERVEASASAAPAGRISTSLVAPPSAGVECVSSKLPFQGGKTHERPLLKASMRDFLFPGSNATQDRRISADVIVQRTNSANSQPGVLTSLFGRPLFVYGAVVQRDPLPEDLASQADKGPIGTILATREGAVLVVVGADRPIWICHVRRPKSKADAQLHPKLPAVMGLLSMPELAQSLGLFDRVQEWSATKGFGADPASPWARRPGTYQQVFVELERCGDAGATVGYVYAEFYNGAFSTLQCEILLEAIKYTLAQPNLKAIVMMGGAGYFSNGIALNVIEGSPDPAAEGWANINAIDDCVEALLAPAGVLTFSAIRGNVAAGGLALATAADVVLSVESAVHNPHYRGLGLYGSEWHTYSWYNRCGAKVAARLTREMLPMSTSEAKAVGMVDHVIDNEELNAQGVIDAVKRTVRTFMAAKVRDAREGKEGMLLCSAPWTRALLPVEGAEEEPLSHQLVLNKAKYLAYLFAGGSEARTLEQHFQIYRKRELEEMTYDFFHPVRGERFSRRCTAFVRKQVPTSTPARFALHRRYESADWSEAQHDDSAAAAALDEEELDAFDSLGDVSATAAVTRLPRGRPELLPRSASCTEVDRTAASGRASTSEGSHGTCAPSESHSTVPSSAPTSPALQESPEIKPVPALPAAAAHMGKALTAVSFAATETSPASSADSSTRRRLPGAARRSGSSLSLWSLSRSRGGASRSVLERVTHFFSSLKEPTASPAPQPSAPRASMSATSASDTSPKVRPASFSAPSSPYADACEDKKSRRASLRYPSIGRNATAPAKTSPECLWSCYYAEDGSGNGALTSPATAETVPAPAPKA